MIFFWQWLMDFAIFFWDQSMNFMVFTPIKFCFFSCDQLSNFMGGGFLPCGSLTEFTIFPSRLTNEFCHVFLWWFVELRFFLRLINNFCIFFSQNTSTNFMILSHDKLNFTILFISNFRLCLKFECIEACLIKYQESSFY